MYDAHQDPLTVSVDIDRWIRQASTDPAKLRMRRTVHIIFDAISDTPSMSSSLFLKGGTLLSLAYGGNRNTGDVDFSTILSTESLSDVIRGTFDEALGRSAQRLGYGMACRVQSIRERPRPDLFHEASAPALQLKIATARFGSNEMNAFQQRKSPFTVPMEISFKEHIQNVLSIQIRNTSKLTAYAYTEIIAEKLRALLQQPLRNRFRRQDFYDIAYLIEFFDPGETEKQNILSSFIEKCAARGITPLPHSLSDPEVVRRARVEWNTLQLEIVGDLPDFDERQGLVDRFYRSLPWALHSDTGT